MGYASNTEIEANLVKCIQKIDFCPCWTVGKQKTLASHQPICKTVHQAETLACSVYVQRSRHKTN